MTLHVQTEFSIPEETIRVARAAYSHGNMLMMSTSAHFWLMILFGEALVN